MDGRDSVSSVRRSDRLLLWLAWLALFASLPVVAVLPHVLPARADPWSEAQTAVAGFVLLLFALVTGVGTFALRETLVSREAEQGAFTSGAADGFWVRTRLVALWLLCALVGGYGGVLGHYAGLPAAAWPYLAGAAALFVIHAPRASFLRRVAALAANQGRG